MFRLLLIGSAVLWLSAMTALFVRDVLPLWTAQQAPAIHASQYDQTRPTQFQYSIRNPQGQVGTAWSNIQAAGGHMTIYGTLLLGPVGIVPRILIETVTEFDTEGALDNFSLDLYGVPETTIKVRGERRGPYFPCELQVGPLRRQASLDLASSRMVGDSLRPFTLLPTLKVGQSWRMQLLNPMTVIMNRKAEFTSVVATVIARETIQHQGRAVECFVVETAPQKVRAWVDDAGEVLRQEVELPGMGKVTVEAEPFDEGRRTQAREQMRMRAGVKF